MSTAAASSPVLSSPTTRPDTVGAEVEVRDASTMSATNTTMPSMSTSTMPSMSTSTLSAEAQIAQDATSLSTVQRWRRALAALAQVLIDPEKTDQVLVFSIHANAGSMKKRIHRFFENENGRRLYAEHRTIDSKSIDLDALAALPSNTLGYAYAHFLKSRGLTPAVFDAPPSEVTDPQIQYVVQRMRQTHDLWHVVTGHDTDPASEVALQAFTFAQVRAPSSAILAVFGTLRGLREKPGIARNTLSSLRHGLRAAPLPPFPWEDHWTTPLVEVRRMLGIPANGISRN